MVNLIFFDLNCTIGVKRKKGPYEFIDIGTLIKEMDYYGVNEAVVTHMVSIEGDPIIGNKKLLQEIKGYKRLYPCWVLVPHYTEEMDNPSKFAKEMLKKGVRIAALYPKTHNFSVSGWSCGDLFKELERYRIPVVISINEITWEERYNLCRKYSQIPWIITGVCDGYTRIIYPLMEKCKNLYLDLSGFPLHSGIEDMVRKFGEQRLLFGSGMSTIAPGSTMMMVCHANVSEKIKRAIAGDNLRSLLRNVKSSEPIDFGSFNPKKINLSWQNYNSPIIDVHGHIGPFNMRYIPENSAEGLIKVMDSLKIKKMCISGSPGTLSDYHIGNNIIAKAIMEYPDRFFGYMIVNPNYPEDIGKELERCWKMGFRGIKIYPSDYGHNYPVTGPAYRKVFGFASEKGCPILSHTQEGSTCDPLMFDKPAKNFSKVNFILAHSGNTWDNPERGIDKCIKVMKKRLNIYADTCGAPQWSRGAIEYMVKNAGSDRWLFGSDTVWLSLPHQLGAFLSAKISDKDRKKILYLNAKRLFDL